MSNKGAITGNPAKKAEMATLKAKGLSNTATANKLGVHQATVGRHTSTDEMQALIQTASERLVNEGITEATDNIINNIKAGTSLPLMNILKYEGGDQKAILGVHKVALDSSKAVLQAGGILPTHAQAVSIQAVIVNADQVIMPTVRDLLVKHELDVIDIDNDC